MIEVTAINNEKMWFDPKRVVMVGPLMDRGVRELGRTVIYFDGLPPLPVKEVMADLVVRLEGGIAHAVVEDGSGAVGQADGSA